jgi:transposase
MSGGELFGKLPEQEVPAKDAGPVRLREPVRDQVSLQVYDLDGLIGPDHPVRVIWSYVEEQDLSRLEESVRARAHRPGQSPASPKLLLALWLYATTQGVGSARALARLCESENAYRWLCGGVRVNYHGLSDFRAAQGELLDELLIKHVASLSAAGVIDLDEVVQDGVRVRGWAGSASYRRRKSLHKEERKARRLVERLRQEREEDPQATDRRRRAAQERGARERAERLQRALRHSEELEEERKAGKRANKAKGAKKQELRVSSSDPEARVMKMADGGFRPAWNCQIATVAQGQIVLAAEAMTTGSDRGLQQPMLEKLQRRYDRLPRRYLIDGGFHKNEATQSAYKQGVLIYGPATRSKHGSDPYAPRADDEPGVAAWRRRMRSPHGKGVYKRRVMHECINARARQWGLRQFTVRGVHKVNAVLRLFALANNILTEHRLAKRRLATA